MQPNEVPTAKFWKKRVLRMKRRIRPSHTWPRFIFYYYMVLPYTYTYIYIYREENEMNNEFVIGKYLDEKC